MEEEKREEKNRKRQNHNYIDQQERFVIYEVEYKEQNKKTPTS